jgi:hypothetical protein
VQDPAGDGRRAGGFSPLPHVVRAAVSMFLNLGLSAIASWRHAAPLGRRARRPRGAQSPSWACWACCSCRSPTRSRARAPHWHRRLGALASVTGSGFKAGREARPDRLRRAPVETPGSREAPPSLAPGTADGTRAPAGKVLAWVGARSPWSPSPRRPPVGESPPKSLTR